MSYDTVILAEPSLTHYYKMNEAAGATTAVDSKGAANGTIGAGITCGSTALFPGSASSYLFNTSAHVTIPSTVGIGSGWSFEFMMKHSSYSLNDSVFGVGSTGNFIGWGRHLQSFWLFGSPGVTQTFSGITLVNNTAYLVTITFNGTTWTCYVNGGTANGGMQGTITGFALSTYGGNSFIGDDESVDPLAGRQSNFSTYSSALGQSSVTAHFLAAGSNGVFIPNYLTGGFKTLTGGIRG